MNGEQEDALKNTIMNAVANGVRQYKWHGGKTSDADSLVKHVTSSVTTMLIDKGFKLADVAVRMKVEQLEQDLNVARRSKNILTKAHKMLAMRLGIWGKKDSTLPGEAWYVWVDRKPSWSGYLRELNKQELPVTEEKLAEQVHRMNTPDGGASFVSEDAAQEYIDLCVHHSLRPYCTPTRREG